MNRQEQNAAEAAALAEKQERERAELAARHAVRELLPDQPAPHFIHATKLYGVVASVKYGDTFQRYQPADHERPFTLRAALDLLASLGEIVPFYIVKDGCTATKPEAAITEREREHGTIHGPFACKVANRHGEGCKLEAFVLLASGAMIDVDIVLDHVARSKFGHWRRTGGSEHFPETYTYERVWAPQSVGAQRIAYGAGSDRGNFSGGQMVYTFNHVSDLDALAVDKPAEVTP